MRRNSASSDSCDSLDAFGAGSRWPGRGAGTRPHVAVVLDRQRDAPPVADHPGAEAGPPALASASASIAAGRSLAPPGSVRTAKAGAASLIASMSLDWREKDLTSDALDLLADDNLAAVEVDVIPT